MQPTEPSSPEPSPAFPSELELRRAIWGTMPGGMAVYDIEGRITHVNPALVALTGFSEQELIGRKPPFPWWPPEDREARERLFRSSLASNCRTSIETVIRRKDGTRLSVSVVSNPVLGSDGRNLGRVAILFDIGGRRKLESKQNLLTTALESADNAVVITNAAGTIQWVNAAFTRLTGYTEEEAFGKSTRLLKSGEQEPAFYERMWRTIQGGEVWRGELVNRRKDATLYAEEMTITPVKENGKVVNYIAIKQDVTERKAAEASKEEAEKRFRLIVENSQDLISIVDTRGRYEYANPAHRSVLGYASEDLAGRSAASRVRSKSRGALLRMLESARDGDDAIAVELELRHKDGHWVPLEVSVRWIRDAAGRPVKGVLVSRDLSERKRLQAEMVQAQKMESVGLLAGGVAHDFNNILTVILANCQFLLQGFEKEDPRRADAVEIQTAGERAAALTRQLLTFSRRQVVQPVPLDLNSLVRNLEKMLRRLIGEDIELRLSLCREEALAFADPGQLEQVVTNLCVNARDAMPKGGRLELRTSMVGKARAVRLEIEDNGAGMPPEILGKLFQPFFTTKPVGKGTGLGLSTVYGIVKQSGGEIAVRSEPGRGTTFSIELPYGPPPAPTGPGRTAPQKQRSAGGTVLLVEDEYAVRRVNERLLAERGFTVVCAADGEQALRILGERGSEIDVLLTDVVMPRMGGTELARRARALRPGLKMLFISGYADHQELEELQRSKLEVLQKPIPGDVLADAVVRALGG